ncbi:12308_t:CDS:2, partial [Cetraspora pellucida]
MGLSRVVANSNAQTNRHLTTTSCLNNLCKRLIRRGKTIEKLELAIMALLESVTACANVLAAVSREHLDAQLPNPSKEYGDKKLSVGAMGAIIKRMAENAGIQGRYTAYSIRISGMIAAIEAGLSLVQIRAIEGWNSKAVMLYLRSVGTA